jgi:hypothetical protein
MKCKGKHGMTKNGKLAWLKRILLLKVLLCFFLWGIPDLLCPASILQRFGVPITSDSIYFRLLGAVILALGVAYFYAWKDPVRNAAIIRAGVVDNGLTTLVTLYFILFRQLTSPIMLVSAMLTFLFLVFFILLMPKEQAA